MALRSVFQPRRRISGYTDMGSRATGSTSIRSHIGNRVGIANFMLNRLVGCYMPLTLHPIMTMTIAARRIINLKIIPSIGGIRYIKDDSQSKVSCYRRALCINTVAADVVAIRRALTIVGMGRGFRNNSNLVCYGVSFRAGNACPHRTKPAARAPDRFAVRARSLGVVRASFECVSSGDTLSAHTRTHHIVTVCFPKIFL